MPKYQYAKSDNLYYCLKQNPIVLAWVLFFTKSSLELVPKPYPPIKRHKFLRWSRSHYQFLKTRSKKLIVLLLYKYRLRNSESSILLPVYGHICKPAHRGYKIFDFRRKRVIKVFDNTVDKHSVVSEIDKLRSILQISFAPSIRRWNIEEYWYEEDYISGFPDVDRSYKPILDSFALKEKFRKDIAPCIETIMLFQKPSMKRLRNYTDEIAGKLKESRLYQQRVKSDESTAISSFCDVVIEQLNAVPDCLVYLLFTHGDFCSANILNTHDNIRIIDWEHVTYRSALFDFYSYFFYRPYRGKITTEVMASEINEAFSFLLSRLAVKAPDIADSIISFEKIYRWLYYIERICMLVEREKTDTNLNIMERMVTFYKVFDQYEEICSSKTMA